MYSYDTIQEVNANSQVRKDGELHPTGTIKYTSDATKSKGKAAVYRKCAVSIWSF